MGKNGRKAAKERKGSKKLSLDELKKLAEKYEMKEVKKEASLTVNNEKSSAQKQVPLNLFLSAQISLVEKIEEVKEEQKTFISPCKENLANEKTEKSETEKKKDKKIWKIPLQRKIYSIDIETSKLPEDKKIVYSALVNENFLGIKGGFAKAVLKDILEHQGKMPKEKQDLNAKTDLDLVLTFVGGREKNIDLLNERVNELTRKLQDVKITLNPADIETIKGNLNNPETIRGFLEGRDLTMNEILLVPSGNNMWKLYYTDKCYRDTINRIGIISTNGAGATRIEIGRTIASPYGISRLLKFLTEEKVDGIYIPDWWIEANNNEAARVKKENLGAYGLILCRRYQDKPEMQKEFIHLLKALGLTDLDNFQQYYQEQKTFFQLWKGEKFEFDPNRSFKDVQKSLLAKEKARKELRKHRIASRKSCAHSDIKTFVCNDCGNRCFITKCAECASFEIKQNGSVWLPNDLPCNQMLAKADVYSDRESFFFP